MSGRGCTITVQVIGGCRAPDSAATLGVSDSNRTENLSLPVALHSPLSVLKEQLQSLTGIPFADQILILCNLSDPERNSDRLLQGLDFCSLRECGLTSGSFITLHALGLSAERQQEITMLAHANEIHKKCKEKDESSPIRTLYTAITAAQANHSYNGVIFDAECKGPYVLELSSIWIAGMLSRVRVYARNSSWEDEKPVARPTPHWWAHRDSMSSDGWELVADVTCMPSWDKHVEVKFSTPVVIQPYSRRALYCHSGLPDDLGIQYQSYRKDDVIAEDDYIALLPGLGHTGSEPFDETHGWYRAYRGLAGGLSYRASWKGWTPQTHNSFPLPLQKAVKTVLLCEMASRSQALVPVQNSSSKQSSSKRTVSIGSLPIFTLYHIFEFMNYNWFVNCPATIGYLDTAQDTLGNRITQAASKVLNSSKMIMSRLLGLEDDYEEEVDDDSDDDDDYCEEEVDEEDSETVVEYECDGHYASILQEMSSDDEEEDGNDSGGVQVTYNVVENDQMACYDDEEDDDAVADNMDNDDGDDFDDDGDDDDGNGDDDNDFDDDDE
mmetsp:Transcript_1550/g.2162  ORF Transcript_1550/g.2162 Transcript_1550/m.2162 type:complete len:553 (-) Transcript_1550:1301-2959(-)